MRLFEIKNFSVPEQVARADFLRKDAAPWFKAIGNPKKKVYRGTSSLPTGTEFAVKAIRKDRKPRDVSRKWTQLLNARIAKIGGIANRTNSAFVTSSWHQAAVYGSPFVFVPLGEFHYTWSPEWHDWAGIASFELAWPFSLNTKLLPKNWLSKEIKVDTGLSQAIARKGEIMISAEKAAYINPHVYNHIVEYFL